MEQGAAVYGASRVEQALGTEKSKDRAGASGAGPASAVLADERFELFHTVGAFESSASQ